MVIPKMAVLLAPHAAFSRMILFLDEQPAAKLNISKIEVCSQDTLVVSSGLITLIYSEAGVVLGDKSEDHKI